MIFLLKQIPTKQILIIDQFSFTGTFLEKANWIFQLYDKDGDGSISKNEMLNIIKSIHNMATINGSEANSPENKVNKIYQEMDMNDDGQLSLGEFIELAKADNMVLNILSSDMTK